MRHDLDEWLYDGFLLSSPITIKKMVKTSNWQNVWSVKIHVRYIEFGWKFMQI